MHYLTFKLSEDRYPDITELLESIISSVLPHKNFDLEVAKVTIDDLFRTIDIQETYGVWYVFFKIFHQMQVVRMYMSDYAGVLDRNVFDSALESGCRSLILQENFNADRYFHDENKSFNLGVEKDWYDAASYVYSECLRVYDDLFERAVPSQQGQVDLISLKQKLNDAYTERVLDISAEVLKSGKEFDGRIYQGPDDSRQIQSILLGEVTNRMSSMSADLSSRFTPDPIRSYEEFRTFKERNKVQVRDLYYMGIDPIDEVMHIRSQDIVTIVADEGVGKTRFAVGQLYQAITQGKTVLYICGESAKIKIENMLIATHLQQTSNLQLSWDEIQDPEKIPTDDLDVLEQLTASINLAAKDLHTNPNFGTVILQQSACYETFYEDIKKTVETYNVDVVFVDHVLAMTSNGDFTSLGRLHTKQLRVTHLYQMEDLLVKDCNIAFINMSHPSTETSKELRAGKRPSYRTGAESSESSRYSSIMGVLYNTAELRNQDIVVLFITKSRDVKQILEPLVLQRHGYSSMHTYDPEKQYLATGASSEEEDFNSLFEDEE